MGLSALGCLGSSASSPVHTADKEAGSEQVSARGALSFDLLFYPDLHPLPPPSPSVHFQPG